MITELLNVFSSSPEAANICRRTSNDFMYAHAVLWMACALGATLFWFRMFPTKKTDSIDPVSQPT